jgi:hypothetical protein
LGQEDPTFHSYRIPTPTRPSFPEWASCIWRLSSIG